ncbi:DUF4147 domain-containing protein [Defluviimonas sp. WL0002]|uniref:DUF4147 domain-containing protein n=1 Tax=Albidovulum marisflavi TaxID=2984159 RepID=A0ABT2ZFF6_9RHOB|nr:DUF4147 domain-containing protein [Defluviimonas sp. WL0002]MCV2869870.1 DUF4147 domain-containing protein [Defluviimonas sp. WL0002]
MDGLRDRARALFSVACTAADPARALEKALLRSPPEKPGKNGRYVVVSIGKAAAPMAERLLARLGGAPATALVVTNYENARDVANATVIAAGHPVPDENGRHGADEVIRRLSEATEQDSVIALISGGGSALLPAPVEGISLCHKAEVNRILLANGFEIGDVNLVRQHLSRLKGGGMLRYAEPAPVTAYILSDVIGDDLRVIASGPTVAPVGSRDEARDLLRRRGLWDRLPVSVQTHLVAPETPAPQVPSARNHLIGSNRISLEAVAESSSDLHGEIVSDSLTGDVAAAAARIVSAAKSTEDTGRKCLIFGGETAVTLKGSGRGGRNQELALRVAMTMPDIGRDWVFLSAGTDGRDGPTEAAGGIVDAGTVTRIRNAGADAEALLANNDSNAALAASGDLLITGATGTNVADVQILIIGTRA